jgi:hypothetical protein
MAFSCFRVKSSRTLPTGHVKDYVQQSAAEAGNVGSFGAPA